MGTKLKLLDSPRDQESLKGSKFPDINLNSKENENNKKEDLRRKHSEYEWSKNSFFGATCKTKKKYLRRLQIGTNKSNYSSRVIEHLSSLREKGKYLTEGTRLEIEDSISIIIKCDPVGGYLSEDTIIYVEESINPLDRIYLLWDLKDYNLLKECISLFVDNPEEITKDLVTNRVYYGPYKINGIRSNKVVTESRSLKLILKEKSESLEEEEEYSFQEDWDNSGRYSGTTYVSEKTPEVFSETESYDDYDFYFFHQDNSGNFILTDFSDNVYNFFDKMFKKYLKDLLEVPRFFFFGNNQLIGDLKFFVSCLNPLNKPGYIDNNTEIYFGFDPFENFDEVTVCPLKDTLPVNYKYNLLEDCVKPFFRLNSFKIFRLGDIFNFSGIQFRITNLSKSDQRHFDLARFMTCPKYGRISSKTEIKLGNPVKPKLMDLLPVERIEILRRSAPCYRENLLICFAADLDVNSLERIYHNSSSSNSPVNSLNSSLNTLTNSTNSSLNNSLNHSQSNPLNNSRMNGFGRHEGSYPNYQLEGNENNLLERSINTCTVCCDLIDTKRPNFLVFLTCGHVFHKRCLSSWLSTKKSCPNCRTAFPSNSDSNSLSATASASGSGSTSFVPLSDHLRELPFIHPSLNSIDSLQLYKYLLQRSTNISNLVPLNGEDITSDLSKIRSNLVPTDISNFEQFQNDLSKVKVTLAPTPNNSPSLTSFDISNVLLNYSFYPQNNFLEPPLTNVMSHNGMVDNNNIHNVMLHNVIMDNHLLDNQTLNNPILHNNRLEDDIFNQYETFEDNCNLNGKSRTSTNPLDISNGPLQISDLSLEHTLSDQFTDEESDSDLEIYFNKLST